MNKILSEQGDWDELLDFISEKQLTPVLGKEIYKFKEADILMPYDEYLSKQLLQVNNVTDQPPLTLTKAVSYLLNERKIKSMDVTRKLKSMVKEVNFEFPLLTEFLSISELSYFINTAVYNNVLEQTVAAIRGQKPTSINFSINEPFSDCDDLEKLKEPFVFNVFGSLLNTVDAALSEEDMLEYTGYFKEKMKGAANIINALRNNNLLFIGCDFPDWMVRFILRLLSNEPLHDWGTKRTIIIVNDNSDTKRTQYDFLRAYDVVTYEGNTTEFVHELATQWKQKNPSAVKPKKIFLSYTVKDKEAVETLKKALEGIENVSCWYDNREITPGDDFKTEIAKNIKSADLFIPLISSNSLMHKDGYVQLEWFTADNVNTFRRIDGNTDKYLMPVVIDDTNPYDTNVPKYFSELSIGKVPQGNPGQEFINQIRKTLSLA
ncbi:MAG: TIR domain-containing protein [Bacteroidota bacterium]|nr:TIR domain-containing protein [Bacteroidota bacterium]